MAASNRPVVHALVPAAGSGQRFGGAVVKQYLPVAGKSVLAHSIDAVNIFPEIAGVTVVLSSEDRMFSGIRSQVGEGVETVSGGATRAESVLNGLKAIRNAHPETQWVLVHDAARPCLSRECVQRLLEQGLQNPDGALLAIPVQDTLKRADESQSVVSTVDREGLWAAQTPQLFPLDRLHQALEAMLQDGEQPTDEAGAMERAGARPSLVMGSPANIKITWPDDVAIAEAWFSNLNQGASG